MDRWEYHVEFMYALAEDHEPFFEAQFPGFRPAKHQPQALIPRLNAIGLEGWELVSLEPVKAGEKGDIGLAGPEVFVYTSTYLAVFKRRLVEPEAGAADPG